MVHITCCSKLLTAFMDFTEFIWNYHNCLRSYEWNGDSGTIGVFVITGACGYGDNTLRPQDGVVELLVCLRKDNLVYVFFNVLVAKVTCFWFLVWQLEANYMAQENEISFVV